MTTNGDVIGVVDGELTTVVHTPETRAAEAVQELLNALGVDEGDHTRKTPQRVAKAWLEMLSGYREDPASHLDVTFSAPTNPGLVIVHGITVNSTCAHHMLPFTGHATVAYRPSNGQSIVGLSKLARLVNGYSRRLQVQERIGAQVVEAITERLQPSGAMCLITATHDCMRLRGVGEPDAATTTEARSGLLLDHEIALIHQRHHGSALR
ncbi:MULTISPECIES: GTP cyclohydrolase I [Mycolicibacterium]|uniref:GTP cyclohydrolase I n=1 Tax=Mycolicibacterium TaxID=1866885 RepID=UPI0011631250|nr:MULTISPECIES: GTP cyclohydrolase I [Mycolicibacterium]MCC9181090.1 GTP cyclohydrolase I [Mycolicibacterium mageritense]QDF19294.1 GTP cyclohydrolase I [Mycobacterium phage Cracklewink]UBV14807.1 GTP cyclohydrolase I [Mycolicibacterium fortuitum]